jgi:hypothetical protein
VNRAENTVSAKPIITTSIEGEILDITPITTQPIHIDIARDPYKANFAVSP